MKKKLITALTAIGLSMMLTACGDKDISGKYVNIADTQDFLTVTKSDDGKLYFFSGKSKVGEEGGAFLKGALLPFKLAVREKDNNFYLDRNYEKIGTINDDTITIEYQINKTYKKKNL